MPPTDTTEAPAEFVNDEQREAHLDALRREREGYEVRGLTDRVKAVDAEIKRIGGGAKPARGRAAAAPDDDAAGE